MRNCVNFLGRKVEWLALCLGLFFLCGIVNFHLRHPTRLQLGKQSVPPGQVDSVIASGPIADLNRAIHRDDGLALPPVPDVQRDWRVGLNPRAHQPASSVRPDPGTVPSPPAPVLVHSLSRLPAARPVAVTFFRGVVQTPALGVVGRDSISPRFRVNGAEMSRWASANFKGISAPPLLAHTQVLAVRVLREQKLPDGSWKPAGAVSSLGIHRLKNYPGDQAEPAAGCEFAQWACANSAEIQRPAFYEVLDGVAPALPVVDIAKAPRNQLLQKLPKPLAPNPDAINLNDVPDFFELGVHDEDVRPGQSYRYRLQYKVFNPLYLNEGLSTPQVARTFAVASEMSDATDAVTVPPREQFFVTGLNGDRARFDLFVLDQQNKPVRQEIVAGPGDAIDGTGWTVVDIRDEHPGRELYVILTDPAGHVVRRTRSFDQADAAYKNLRERT